MREQAHRINELEAADNRRGQEIDAIMVNMHSLVKNLQTRDRVTTDGEDALTKRIDHHRRALNILEDDLRSLGVKHKSLLEEVERLSSQVCRCGVQEDGSDVESDTLGLSYTSPPSSQGGLVPISSDEYEDAEDRSDDAGEDHPHVVIPSSEPIPVAEPVVRGPCAVRSSGPIRSQKSNRGRVGPYFRRGGGIVVQSRGFTHALADVVADRWGRDNRSSSSLPASSSSRGSDIEDRAASDGRGADASGVPPVPFFYDCYGKCGGHLGWGDHGHDGDQWRPSSIVVRGERRTSE